MMTLEQQNAELLRQNAELEAKVNGMQSIIDAFGYGQVELTEEHAKLARELLENN